LDERWTIESGAALDARPRRRRDPIDDQPAPNLFAGVRHAETWG